MSLQHDILKWREQQAQREGIESFKILSKACIDAIVYAQPTTKEELTSIKGIKEAKYKKYGQAIFALVKGEHDLQKTYGLDETPEKSSVEEPLSVSLFLDALNTELSGLAARIKGEVTSVSERPRVIYFTLKDSIDESTLDCLIWRNHYELSGVRLAIGDEVIVEGVPEVYKPTGRLSLKTLVIEVSGEGALKKAYDELYAKLERQGYFAPENKQVLPTFPKRIGLITSLDGAALGDFQMNLGRFGFAVALYPSSVEGKRSVFEILEAIRYFENAKEPVDVLVIIRGGGSLESLQAFNTEAVAEAIYRSPLPTLVGVGHEKDVTLAALSADRMESTPTACAKALSAPFQEAQERLARQIMQLTGLFQEWLRQSREGAERMLDGVYACVDVLKEEVSGRERRFREFALTLHFTIREEKSRIQEQARLLGEAWRLQAKDTAQYLAVALQRLEQYDPLNALKLGYSLVQQAGRVVKDSSGLAENDILNIRFAHGGVETKITKVL